MAASPTASAPPDAGRPEAATSGRFATFAALSHRNFRCFWFAQLSSVSAQTMEFVAVAWLILDLTQSPFMLGLTSLAQALPTLVGFLVAGAAADRMDRRRLLTFLFGFGAVVYFGLGVLVLTNTVQPWAVVLGAFLLGVMRLLDQPARHGMLPHTVPRKDLPNAVAMASMAFQIPRPIAPALAGVLIAIVGIGPTFCVIGSGALLAMILYSMLRVDAAPRAGESHGWREDMLDGLRFVWRDQLIYGLIGMTFVNSLFGMSYVVLLPVLAREELHVGAEGYGLMQTAAGVGGLAGALVAARFARSGHRGRQAIGGAIVFGALLITLSYCPWYAVACVLLFCVGMANQLYMTTTTTVLQLSIPNELRGRVMSIWGLTFSLIPTGGAISGTVAEHFGAPVAMALGGIAVIVTTVAAAAMLPRIRQLDKAVSLH